MNRDSSSVGTFAKRGTSYRGSEAGDATHRGRDSELPGPFGRILRSLRVSVRVAIVGLVAVCVMVSAVPQITIWWSTATSSTDTATEFLMRSIKNESVSVFTQICEDSERVIHQFELAAQRNPQYCEDSPVLLDSWRETLDTMMVSGRELEFAGYANTFGYQCSAYGRGPQPFYKETKPILWRQDPRGGAVGFNRSYMSWYMEWNESSEDWYIGETTGQNSTWPKYDTLRRGWYTTAIGDSSFHWDGPDLSLPEIFLCLSLSKSWSPRGHPEKKCGVIILQVSLTNIGAKLRASRVRSSNIWIVSNDDDWTIVATSRNASTELYKSDGSVVRMPVALSEDKLTASVGKAARRLSEQGKLGTLQRTEYFGTRMLICSTTRDAVGDRMVLRHLGHVRVKGFAQVQEIYELVGRTEKTDPVAMRRTTLFNDAVSDLDSGRLEDARCKLDEYIGLLGSSVDAHALRFVRKIEEAQRRGSDNADQFAIDLSAGV
eukprot:m51a1_g9499 hypothetical protein (489) ;mRNA; r:661779-663629